MKTDHSISLLIFFFIGLLISVSSGPSYATHDPFIVVAGNGYEADQCHDFSKCGYNGPLLWNPYTVIASSLAWTKKHWEVPMLHATRRGSEFGQSEHDDPVCFDEL